MDNSEILQHTTLLLRIEALKADQAAQDADLKQSAKELIFALNPITIMKGSLHDLAGDKEVHLDMAKVGLNLGANLIIDQVLGKQRSAKGFISAVVVELISTALINSNASKIVLEMSRLLSPDTRNTNQAGKN
jgi:hypothetical protein